MADVVLRGLGFPFHRDATDLTVVESVEQVLQNIANVLTTPKGTLPWRPDFGSELHRLRHANVESIGPIAQQFVAQALKRWVPYIRLQGVKAEVVETALRLTISYKIISGSAARTESVEQAVTVQS